MNNTIREEFKEYITNLVNQITENILLDDMEQLLKEYLEGFNKFSEHASDMEKKNNFYMGKLHKQILDFRQIEMGIKEELAPVEEIIEVLNGEYKEVFAQFSSQVQMLNQKERERFVAEQKHVILDIEEYIKLLDKKMEEGIQKIIAQVDIGAESVVKTRSEADIDNNVHTNNMIYLREFIENINIKQREILQHQIMQQLHVQAELDDEKIKAVNLSVRRIETEQLEEIKKTLGGVENLLSKGLIKLIEGNNALTHNSKVIIEKLENQQQISEERNQKQKETNILLIASNLMVALFMMFNFVLMKPWNVFGLTPTLILAGVILIIGLIMIFRKSLVKMLQKSNLEMNKHE